MRSICCWGAGSSSMKPERVRGLIIGKNSPFCCGFKFRQKKKSLQFVLSLGRKQALLSWCHPNSNAPVPSGLLPGAQNRAASFVLQGVREGDRGRLRPRSAAVFRPSFRGRGFQPVALFSGRRG